MNRAFTSDVMRPNLPLRKPSTSPGGVLTAPSSPRALTPRGIMGSISSPGLPVNLCNYCSQQGNLRCTRCKKTCYCSVACQAEDWKAHRHLCKPSASDSPTSEKLTKEAPSSLVYANGPSLPESKVKQSTVPCTERVYMWHLRKNDIAKGAELQASVVELRSPAMFFLHVQSPELVEALRGITMELQNTYSNSPDTAYTPGIGEVCAVKFSLDQSWYRGLVQLVAPDQKMANVLYIDFGNEEDVSLARIRPLAATIEPIPPCALECHLAGVRPLTDSWPGECTMAVRQLLTGKSLAVSVVDQQASDRTFAVDIMMPSLGKQLSTFLIDQGYAGKEAVVKKPTEQDIDFLVSASLENFKRRSGGKDENAEGQPPEPQTQGLGDSFTAVVTHLHSPDDIICQKLENACVIQELQLQLRSLCSQAPPSENFRPAPGTVCCSLFSEDSQWYRAKVLAYPSEDSVCVGYIDFGNSEEVNLCSLRPLSPELVALPMQAIPCALAGVFPVDESWTDEAVLTLRRTVCNRFLRVDILGERDGTALVGLTDESTDPQSNVAELLLSSGYAVPTSQKTDRASQPQAASSEPLVWSCAELPCEGQAVALVISVMVDPGEFYCYILNPQDLQVLSELGLQVKQHCEAESAPFSPKVGQPCCALFAGDGAWYRGMVQRRLGEGKASVYFVDYGNTSEVETAQLRAVTPQLLTHPFQAIRCWLAGVAPPAGRWSSEALVRFQSLCDGQQLTGRVLSITERGYGVELESVGHNVASVLLSEKLVLAPRQTQQAPPEAAPARAGQPKAVPVVQKEQPVKVKEAMATFPVDWRTVELPRDETFQPQIAAVISPSLFYLLNPSQVDIKELQQVMIELSVHCSSQVFSPCPSPPAPGAACCAQFSGDKNWYRAVVLESTESWANVIFADYGNSEKLPYSSLLPIPTSLLQLPFQIVRCALTGKEHFPSEWPSEVLELFGALLSYGILATVQGFDGTANLLSVTLGTEKGGGHLNAMILDGLQSTKAQAKTPSPPSNPTKTSSPLAKTPGPDSPTPKPPADTSRKPECNSTTPGQNEVVGQRAKTTGHGVHG
ncbi:tudor domain-containing protein 1 [Aplochiton taeniatus]